MSCAVCDSKRQHSVRECEVMRGADEAAAAVPMYGMFGVCLAGHCGLKGLSWECLPASTSYTADR